MAWNMLSAAAAAAAVARSQAEPQILMIVRYSMQSIEQSMIPRRPSGQSHIWPVVEILVRLDVVAFGLHCGPLFGENYYCKGICDWLSCRKRAICVICALSQIDVEVVCLLMCIFICLAWEHSELQAWFGVYTFFPVCCFMNICGCFNSGGDFPAEFLPFLFLLPTAHILLFAALAACVPACWYLQTEPEHV